MNSQPNDKLTTQANTSHSPRLFVSIELPQAVLEEIIRLQKEIKQLNLFEGTYVRPENLHITLAFFGPVEAEKIPLVHERLASISFPVHAIKLMQLGVNSLSRPHVLWITLDSPLLSSLAQAISALFPEYQEQRPFNGHITIARMKKVKDKNLLHETLTTVPVSPHEWQAYAFSLWESQTLPEGPVYTLLGTFTLLA